MEPCKGCVKPLNRESYPEYRARIRKQFPDAMFFVYCPICGGKKPHIDVERSKVISDILSEIILRVKVM